MCVRIELLQLILFMNENSFQVHSNVILTAIMTIDEFR